MERQDSANIRAPRARRYGITGSLLQHQLQQHMTSSYRSGGGGGGGSSVTSPVRRGRNRGALKKTSVSRLAVAVLNAGLDGRRQRSVRVRMRRTLIG